MYNNDIRNVATKEIIVDIDEQVKDPIYFLEKQANRGAYGVMMPVSPTRALIKEKCSAASGYRHDGEKLQIVGKALSSELGLPHFRVRARMIQLGYPEAKGALNYADRHMIEPFAFDTVSCKEERFTFVIDKQTVINLGWQSEDFRAVMATGNFIYADGHVVRNDPRCVMETRAGLRLTPWANAHVDKCCLRFVRLYIQNSVGKYVFGRLNYDADYVRQTKFYLEDLINTEHFDELDAQFEYSRRFPKTFHEAFDMLRKKNRLSIAKTAEQMNMDDSTLKRWLDDPRRYRNEDFLTIVSLLFQLPDWISNLLFKRAHFQLDMEDRRHQAIGYILRVQSADGIDAANQYLASRHLEPLTIAG